VGHFLQSGLRARCAKLRHFERFRVDCRPVSLQSRLRGGEGGIRTLGTGVSPYNGLAKHKWVLNRLGNFLLYSRFQRVTNQSI
jgi:hypothetical protein